MQTKKISIKIILFISIVTLLLTNTLTYILLLSKNEEWKDAEKMNYGGAASIAVDALLEHVYYDGDSIPLNQTVKHYSRSGKELSNENLGILLKGEKIVMLLSPNCCSFCAINEITMLLDLTKKIGRERLIFVADFALHSQSQWSMCFDQIGYYETDAEHLGLDGSLTRETPVVMLTENGRVKTSFLVNKQTRDYAEEFHKYLVEYFKEKK